MPSKLQRICPACGAIVRGRCAKCEQHHEHGQVRKGPGSKAYGRRWRARRTGYLAEHPLCLTILEDGKPCNQPATEIDHIQEIESEHDSLFWDESNWFARCKSCHSRKTMRDVAGRHKRERFVVCGLPGAGKSTYVREHRKAGDFVWDWDEVARTVYGMGRSDLGEARRHILLAMLNASLASVARSGDMRAWIIVTRREWANNIAARIGGVVIELDTGANECRERVLKRDDANTRRSQVLAVLGVA